jgi:8-oxo-dGTP pyrophosphatase MutT (NUDIX family)
MRTRRVDGAGALLAGDPALAFAGDLAVARRAIEEYEPKDSSQASFRGRILDFIDAHPRDAHLRSSLTGHLTASALVLDAQRERALLTHHKKLGLWLQLGGHCDGNANLAACALREATEESGIADLAILPRIVDLDIHPIPARTNEPEHLHLDARFFVFAPQGASFVVSEESHELGWIAPDALDSLRVDDSVRRLFRLAFAN